MRVIDPAQEAVVWALSGLWLGQHQPTLLPDGNLLVFDNKGHDGRSKVVEIDPTTQRVVWEFADGPDTPFYSATCGTGQRLANGNTLITESDNGRALELAAEVLDGAPLSVQAARDTVMLSTEMGRSAALRAARHASTHCYQSEDAQEGPRAFAEKRRPRWQGR